VGVVVDRDLGEVPLVGGLHAVEGAPTWSESALVHHTDRRVAPSADPTSVSAEPSPDAPIIMATMELDNAGVIWG
jgi:hypothetical protein